MGEPPTVHFIFTGNREHPYQWISLNSRVLSEVKYDLLVPFFLKMALERIRSSELRGMETRFHLLKIVCRVRKKRVSVLLGSGDSRVVPATEVRALFWEWDLLRDQLVRSLVKRIGTYPEVPVVVKLGSLWHLYRISTPSVHPPALVARHVYPWEKKKEQKKLIRKGVILLPQDIRFP